MIKIWIDDVRPAPNGYMWCKSVQEAKKTIMDMELMYTKSGGKQYYAIELLDMDHDAGDFVGMGGDYIRLLDWMETTKRSYPIHIHSMNPVGVENMKRIIQRNNWTLI